MYRLDTAPRRFEAVSSQPLLLTFGNRSRQPLPSLGGYKIATHTTGNAEGVKKERAAIRVIPKPKFAPTATTRELVAIFCGLSDRELSLWLVWNRFFDRLDP